MRKRHRLACFLDLYPGSLILVHFIDSGLPSSFHLWVFELGNLFFWFGLLACVKTSSAFDFLYDESFSDETLLFMFRALGSQFQGLYFRG